MQSLETPPSHHPCPITCRINRSPKHGTNVSTSTMSNNNQNANPDNLTHPRMYRDFVNHPHSSQQPHQHSPSSSSAEVGKNDVAMKPTKAGEAQQEEDQWDLYPQLIREIENTGTPEQVEHLHDLERSPSRP